MRYLREYKIFESTSTDIIYSIIDNCKDILLDLNDLYIDTQVKIDEKRHIDITVYQKNTGQGGVDNRETFNWTDIKDIIDRLSSYLKSEGFSICYPITASVPVGSKAIIHPVDSFNKLKNRPLFGCIFNYELKR